MKGIDANLRDNVRKDIAKQTEYVIEQFLDMIATLSWLTSTSLDSARTKGFYSLHFCYVSTCSHCSRLFGVSSNYVFPQNCIFETNGSEIVVALKPICDFVTLSSSIGAVVTKEVNSYTRYQLS